MPKQKKMWDNVLTVIMSVLCLLWIYPIVLILLNSLKKEGTFTTSTVFQLPTKETFVGLSNYVYGVTKMGFLSSLGYSLLITITSVFLILLCCYLFLNCSCSLFICFNSCKVYSINNNSVFVEFCFEIIIKCLIKLLPFITKYISYRIFCRYFLRPRNNLRFNECIFNTFTTLTFKCFENLCNSILIKTI